ncbi:Fanconi anemia group D2 protein [Apophysomyces sp. BC1034]|nr:Fanconi anemia group D2 protein [Apophysomyces sp. BC1015]KAG0173218.1 Fanconi anemia group D2 protein [Apophysomyces sp. BC1021]KAG0185446.1 Fanconi anemia group D2 protein [Apophysomyces sp. BC1034]
MEIDVSLKVLLRLCEDDSGNMAVYGVFLKGILDYLDNLSSSQTRMLFDILSILALKMENRSNSGGSNLWSEVHIVIRKQLSNPREKYKRIGIIGCLSAVKVLGCRDLCTDQASGSSTQGDTKTYTAEQAQKHPLLRQAVDLLEMMLHNCRDYAKCLAFMFDELAHVVENGNLDERLQLWIKENLTDDFISNYVSDAEEMKEFVIAQQVRDAIALKPSMYMNLDGEDAAITVRIYDLIHGVESKKRISVVIPFCPMFKLLQTCERQLNSGSLENIDALLGCSVVLFLQDDIEELNQTLQTEELEDACHLLFYSINWFRELLNCFSTTDSDVLTNDRLVARLKNIRALETLLEKLMMSLSSYVPFESEISSPVLDGREARGTQMLNQSMRETPEDSSSVVQGSGGESLKPSRKEQNRKTNAAKVENITDLREHMRAFEVHVLNILKLFGDSSKEEEVKLNYGDINYLLVDVNHKLSLKIVPPPTNFFKKKKVSEEKHISNNAVLLERVDSPALMKEVIKYLPNILHTLEGLYEDIQLTDLIDTLADRIRADPSKQQPLETSIVEAFQYLARFGDNIPESNTSVVLYKLLTRLMEISSNPGPLNKGAHSTVTRILTTDWFDWRNIKKDIPFLVEQAIELDNNPLQVLHDYVNIVLPTFERDGRLEGHPLLRDDTIVVYYQAVINQTVKSLYLLQDTDQEAAIVLAQNQKLVKIFERITYFVKMKNQRILYNVLLKTGRAFVEKFTKHSIPYFTDVFKKHKDVIVGIFKDFQTSTRLLQIICSHVKVLKDIQLSGYVPPLKKALEIVIFQVKMLLTQNNAPSDAFFMGALKHRDIKGEEVSSQLPQNEASDSDEGEDQLDSERSQNEPPAPSRKRARSAHKEKSPQLPRNVIRTTSQVPSSSEEEDDDDDKLGSSHTTPGSTKGHHDQEEEEEEEEVLEISLDSDDSDSADSPVVSAPTPPLRIRDDPMPPEPSAKKRRLGLGRPNIPQHEKPFSLERQKSANDK